MQTTLEKLRQHRKMLLILPPLILVMALAAFWGYRQMNKPKAVVESKGINASLPSPDLKRAQPKDKMDAYDQQKRDSARQRSSGALADLGWDTAGRKLPVTDPERNAAANEQAIKQRLVQIRTQLAKPPVNTPPVSVTPENEQLTRLEKLLKEKQQSAAPDPQMAQLNTMLDKIAAIQNPALAVKVPVSSPVVRDTAFKAILALIDGNQKVAPGGVVRLKLRDTLRLAGLLLPKGQSLFGACSVMNQRLLLEIKNIRLGSAIIPVSLTVFGLDGLPGINAPEAELGEAAGSGTANALDNMQFFSMDQSIGTQAATAGITAAKGLLGKKAREIRVKLHNNEAVLLRINKN